MKRGADGGSKRSRENIGERREQPKFFWNTLTDSKHAILMILKQHSIALIRKEELSPSNKARGKTSANELVKRSKMPARVMP